MLLETDSHLSVIVFDNLKVKKFILILCAKNGIPAARLGNVQVLLRAEVIG